MHHVERKKAITGLEKKENTSNPLMCAASLESDCFPDPPTPTNKALPLGASSILCHPAQQYLRVPISIVQSLMVAVVRLDWELLR